MPCRFRPSGLSGSFASLSPTPRVQTVHPGSRLTHLRTFWSRKPFVTFTALTLIIGEPFYERIHRETEEVLGPPLPNGSVSLWRAVVSGVGFVLRGIGVGLVVAVLGFIPVVGGALAAVVGVALTGSLLARELMARAFDAREFDDARRAQLLAAAAAFLGGV